MNLYSCPNINLDCDLSIEKLTTWGLSEPKISVFVHTLQVSILCYAFATFLDFNVHNVSCIFVFIWFLTKWQPEINWTKDLHNYCLMALKCILVTPQNNCRNQDNIHNGCLFHIPAWGLRLVQDRLAGCVVDFFYWLHWKKKKDKVYNQLVDNFSAAK